MFQSLLLLHSRFAGWVGGYSGIWNCFGSLVIRECTHFFTLPEDPVMVMRCRHSQDRASPPSALRKIKPQRAQRITESCYFYLSYPLCPLWFSKKPYFENIKKSPGFWSPQREITQASTTESLPTTHCFCPSDIIQT